MPFEGFFSVAAGSFLVVVLAGGGRFFDTPAEATLRFATSVDVALLGRLIGIVLVVAFFFSAAVELALLAVFTSADAWAEDVTASPITTFSSAFSAAPTAVADTASVAAAVAVAVAVAAAGDVATPFAMTASVIDASNSTPSGAGALELPSPLSRTFFTFFFIPEALPLPTPAFFALSPVVVPCCTEDEVQPSALVFAEGVVVDPETLR